MRAHGGTEVQHKSLWLPLVVTVMLLELPGVLNRCVFDEVQAEVRVVRAALGQPRSLTSKHHFRYKGLKLKKRSILGKDVPPSSCSPPQPIRIKTWTARESHNLSETERERLQAAVEGAVREVSSLLSVNRTTGPLLLSRDIKKYCRFLWRNSSTVNYNRCGRANKSYRKETCLDQIPDDHLSGCEIYPAADSPHRTVLRAEGSGLHDADFLLYINVRATDKCRAEPDLLAYAVHCRTDAQGRPVAGVVVICRHRLTGAAYSHRSTVQTVIHELFHVLGFSKDLFSTWRDCLSSSQDGASCSPRSKVIHSDESGQMRIYTPSVISALQRHLVSSDLDLGGPLENLDSSLGRVSSHWEARVLQGSIMAAVLGDPTTVRIDPVTLAALQDAGWYTVNLSRAQSLVWGNREGSTFGSLSTCKEKPSSFFCTGSGVGCHFLHLHKGACQTDQYLEGCRIYKPLKNASECWKKENTRWSSENSWSGEIYGFDSRCFFSSLVKQEGSVQTSSSVEGRCYRHRCTGLNRYQVQVSGSDWVDCPAGGAIQIPGYQGSVFCPDRRFCLYPDVAPPSEDNNPLPACITRDPLEASPPAQTGTWSVLGSAIRTAVVTSLSFAATCFLAVLVVSHRKCQKIRVQTVTPEDGDQL